VVNLSLLQTEWYARQLRDRPPLVPLALTNAEIAAVAPRREKNRVITEKEILVRAILAANQWLRPVYLAVTVPDQMGLSEQLQMEGLSFRIHPRPPGSNVNAEVGYENLARRYLYRGFMNPDGTPDTKVYKDEQTRRILQNYTAVGVRVVMGLRELGRRDDALSLMRWVQAAAPDTRPIQMAVGLSWERLGAWREAREHYDSLLKQYPGDPEVLGQIGHALAAAGDSSAAVGWLEQARAAGPGRFFNTYAELATIYHGQRKAEMATAVLTEWLRYNAGDPRGQELLSRLSSSAIPPGR
jgi:tetratricopeptide (TPR) repeat protein